MRYFAITDGDVVRFGFSNIEEPPANYREITEAEFRAYTADPIKASEYRLRDGAIVHEPPPVDLGAYLAERRWLVETGGITVAGVAVATDDRSKLMIAGARIKAKEDPATTKRWKTLAGFVELDAAALIAIADAVEAHVQACFDLEADLTAQIAAGTVTTPGQIDAAFAALATLAA